MPFLTKIALILPQNEENNGIKQRIWGFYSKFRHHKP